MGMDDMHGRCQAGLGLNQVPVSEDDPWGHRGLGMRCRTCMWFALKEVEGRENQLMRVQGFLGRCRRHAPTMSGFPAVYEEDWCGDHKVKG